MRLNFFTLLLLLLIASCQGEQNNNNDGSKAENLDLGEALQGTWQTYQLNIAVNTADGLDSFRAEYLNQEIWEKNLGIQPPIYYFQPDGKYRLVRLGLNGDTMDEIKGSWSTSGDTLRLVGLDTLEYLVKQANGRAGFRTFLDWDGDGAEDDEYQSIQRRISIGSN